MSDTLIYQVLGGLATFAASIGGMRVMVTDLREKVKEAEAERQSIRDRVTRLEERHDGLVQKIDHALDKLETVTGKLEALAIRIAGER